MSIHFFFFLPKVNEKAKETSLVVTEEHALKLVFLGILADDKHFPGMYQFQVMAEEPQTEEEDPDTTEGKTKFLQRLQGTATYMKWNYSFGAKLKTLQATDPFVGLLDRLGLEYVGATKNG